MKNLFLLIPVVLCSQLSLRSANNYPAPEQTTELVVRQNEVLEISFLSTRVYENPYLELDVEVQFTGEGSSTITVPAFWAGGDIWKVRFSSPSPGRFHYQSRCSDAANEGLNGRAGQLVVLPYQGPNELLRHGPLRVDTSNHIVHADGAPFLWLADSWWHGMTRRLRWPEGFQQLTLDRKEKGFSVIQFAIGYPCDIVAFDPRGANEAGFPTSPDYEKINPEYFEWTDLRIQYLIANELVPNIVGTWGYYLPWFGIENMKRYWRYLIARYGAYPVAWTLAGETTLTYYLTEEEQQAEIRQYQRDGWSEVAQYIKANDPFRRLLTAHPGPASGDFRPISDMTPLDLIMVQPGHRGWPTFARSIDHLQRARRLYPDKPAMQGEVCFEGMHGGGCDAKLQRLLFWTNMLSGAAGHCYGADAIWQFNTEEESFGASPGGHIWGNAPWEEAYQWKGSLYVGLGRKILQQYDWQHFEFRPAWVEPTADAENVEQAYAAGIPGEVRLYYFPGGVLPWGQRYHLLELDPGSTCRATFIDPLTGERYPVEGLISGVKKWEVPPAPILQDWLLELQPAE